MDMRKSCIYVFVMVMALLQLYSCSRTSEELITKEYGVKYYEVTKKTRKGIKKGIKDLDGNIIVPVEMSEIKYYRCYNDKELSIISNQGLEVNDFQCFLCETDGDFDQIYKLNGDCVIGKEKGYEIITSLAGWINESFHWSGYEFKSQDGLYGYCNHATGKVIVPPTFKSKIDDLPVFVREIPNATSSGVSMKVDNYGEVVKSVILVPEDGSAAYDINGNCLVSSTNDYVGVRIEDDIHMDIDDERYFFFCARKDYGIDVRSAKGKLLCSAGGGAVLKRIDGFSETSEGGYFVCGSNLNTEYDYEKALEDHRLPRFGMFSDQKETISVYDIYGDFVFSEKGIINGETEWWESKYRNPDIEIGYDKKRGFYCKRRRIVKYDDDLMAFSGYNSWEYDHDDEGRILGYDDEEDKYYYLWLWDEDNPIYVNKWLDKDLHVTDKNPNSSSTYGSSSSSSSSTSNTAGNGLLYEGDYTEGRWVSTQNGYTQPSINSHHHVKIYEDYLIDGVIKIPYIGKSIDGKKKYRSSFPELDYDVDSYFNITLYAPGMYNQMAKGNVVYDMNTNETYNPTPTQHDNSNTGSSQQKPRYEQKRHDCGLCGGSGEWAHDDESIPDFGNGNKYCSKCGKTVGPKHIHTRCPSCGGNGWW